MKIDFRKKPFLTIDTFYGFLVWTAVTSFLGTLTGLIITKLI